ncbi:uncharacterized protein LOC134774708 [Penaeus indicus]|uniref:uncharacterized protein LOC134774708 n=1 Tax=Penaeus indicus TaxID=29960 RepID=UPI00300C9BF6
MLRLTAAALVLLACWRAVRGEEGALWCYECGTNVTGEPDCVEFLTSGTWTAFRRQCAGDDVCVKTVPGWNMADEEGASVKESWVSRGCTPQRSVGGVAHKDGCWSGPNSAFLICYCSNDFCNAARTPAPALTPALLGLVAAYVVLGG